ncbi:UNVERIFIED_CONTAM: Pentatricopeptide repeat-containing protein, chloroplastic [Sesamum calycinum]|uniref:Pentatricopeptide repeat-containing protein, chloroplastic n=1 Tax=Sesamum calycinum TaxID=2727403 RepID=A0AAW2J4J7_9LAMI
MGRADQDRMPDPVPTRKTGCTPLSKEEERISSFFPPTSAAEVRRGSHSHILLSARRTLKVLFHFFMKAPFPLKSVAPKLPIVHRSSYISPTQFSELLGRAKNLKHAVQIHAQLITRSCLSSPFLFNCLLNLYSKCGHVSQSLALFSASNSITHLDETKNVFTYTSLITQLSHCNLPFKALTFFNELRGRNISPNHFTFSAVLPACGDTRLGKQMHSLICKHGFESDVFVGSALVDMYAKSGELDCARRVFDEMPERNLVSWNSVIVGFLRNGCYDQAIGFFTRLIGEDAIGPDEVSFSSVLSACAHVCGVAIGRQVHGVVLKHGLEYLAYVKNSLMDMYCKCGFFDDAEKLFRNTQDRDVVSWNIMVMGFVQNGNFEDACNYFWVMRREGILPDEASFSTVLHAAACIAAFDQGALIHNQILKTGLGGNTCVASSLITMYAKCGSLVDARRAFSESEEHNVISWTAMLSAFQQHGCANQVIELFDDMMQAGIEPDYITFVSVLSACGHTGRVDDGFSYFNLMSQSYNMNPGLEHYACMVDLLGRAGRLYDAKKFVESMPIEPDVSVWGALLGACRKYGDLNMGREVAERLFEIEPDNPGTTCCCTTCMLVEEDWKKQMRSHSRTNEIYEMLAELEELVKQKGYVPEIQHSINDMDEYEERKLWYHSEKLALAYGLLTLPVGAPIRIKKNLRTCCDCHNVMKFASAIFKREIILRDINRFHRFADGLCSCGDYW